MLKLARYLARNGASGLEFFSGIPQVYGVIRMNAGAYDIETSHYLKKIKIITEAGAIKYILSSDYKCITDIQTFLMIIYFRGYF